MLEKYCREICNRSFRQAFGRVLKVSSNSVVVSLPEARVGSQCSISTSKGIIKVEIVALSPQGHIAMPLDDLSDVSLNDRVDLDEIEAVFPIGKDILGDVVDSMGNSYLKSNRIFDEHIPLYGLSLNPMERNIINTPIDLGIRSINACLTCGKGQRQGIFSGSGVGKSVLLGMIARYTKADVVVIALVGERGREVREFLENDLGKDGQKKAVVVVETAEKSAVRRVRAAFAATAIAEYFRNKKLDVLLMMDSLSRFAMARREIGMIAGEPPTTKGYTPSVFSSMSKLVERAGNWGSEGSITGLYTVLVEGDDFEDPIADGARSILDGHIMLSRKLSNRGHYPAVDVLSSVSRIMAQVVDEKHLKSAQRLKELLARYFENEDAIQYGMYTIGTDQRIDESIKFEPQIASFLKQKRDETITYEESKNALIEIMNGA